MPFEHLATFSGTLVRRAAVGNGGPEDMAQLPGWAVLVFFADFLVFAPAALYVGHTTAQP